MSKYFLRIIRMDESLNKELERRIEDLAIDLLGEPLVLRFVDMQWGTDADIVIRTHGVSRGRFTWRSREASGDALSFIATALDITRGNARAFALEWLSVQP